jgi:hypothetical protein
MTKNRAISRVVDHPEAAEDGEWRHGGDPGSYPQGSEWREDFYEVASGERGEHLGDVEPQPLLVDEAGAAPVFLPRLDEQRPAQRAGSCSCIISAPAWAPRSTSK